MTFIFHSFVIKTADTKDGTKVFINVCASDKVPAPGNWKTGQMPEEVSMIIHDKPKFIATLLKYRNSYSMM